MAIDVGWDECTDQSKDLGFGVITVICFYNAANAGGTIDAFQIQENTAITGLDIGSFTDEGSGSFKSPTGYGDISQLSASGGPGACDSFSDPGDFDSFSIDSGQYLGAQGDGGKVECDDGVVGDYWYWVGNAVADNTSHTYTETTNKTPAFYATGTEAGGEIYNESITEILGQNDIIKATSVNNISAIETFRITSILNLATILGLKLQENFTFLDILEILLPEGATYNEAIIEALGLSSCLPAFYHLFSRGEVAALPTDNDNDLANLFSCNDYEDVVSDDDTYLTQEADEGYAVFLWKEQHTNDSDPIEVTWKGKSNVAPADSTIVLQIFNRNSNTWENLDSDNTSGAGTEITLTGQKTSSLSNYYDSEKWISFRVYQAVG